MVWGIEQMSLHRTRTKSQYSTIGCNGGLVHLKVLISCELSVVSTFGVINKSFKMLHNCMQFTVKKWWLGLMTILSN